MTDDKRLCVASRQRHELIASALQERIDLLQQPAPSLLHDGAEGCVNIVLAAGFENRQLQTTMRQFEQTLGVVENIDTTSRQLKEALESGKTIIVTTLQKFPVIAKEIGELPGKRFAVIVDEAHSSQSGESTRA